MTTKLLSFRNITVYTLTKKLAKFSHNSPKIYHFIQQMQQAFLYIPIFIFLSAASYDKVITKMNVSPSTDYVGVSVTELRTGTICTLTEVQSRDHCSSLNLASDWSTQKILHSHWSLARTSEN